MCEEFKNKNSLAIQICSYCDERFPSRNQLFKHLKVCSSNSKTELIRDLSENQFNDEDLLRYSIYVTGGRVRGRTLGSVERFNFRLNAWELCPPLLENRGSHGTTAINQNIFVVGGGGFASNLNSCETLNIRESVWTRIASSNILRHALALVPFHPGKLDPSDLNTWSIYAIGGWIEGKLCSSDVEKYDISTDTWTKCASMNVARRLLGATVYNRKIYTFGGNCDDGVWYTGAVEVYDPITDIWEQLQDMPVPGPTSAAISFNKIYIFAHGKRVYEYDLESNKYKVKSLLPLPEWYTFDITCCGPYVFLHGGASKGIWSRAMFRYDTQTDSWLEYPSMLRQRRRCAAAIVTIT
jgi:hypothetical protein